MRGVFIAVAASILLMGSTQAWAENQFTKDDALADARLRLTLWDCMAIPIGRIHIRPFNEPARSRFIVSLEKAGVISVRNADTSNGDVFQDLLSYVGKDVGEGDLEITLAPNVDKNQIEVRFTNQTCLQTGLKTTNVQLVSYDATEMKRADFTSRKIIIAQGKYDSEGALNSLYAATLAQMGTKAIQHGKFRTLYVYDPFRDHWDFKGMDLGDVREATFRLNLVEQGLSEFKH